MRKNGKKIKKKYFFKRRNLTKSTTMSRKVRYTGKVAVKVPLKLLGGKQGFRKR